MSVRKRRKSRRKIHGKPLLIICFLIIVTLFSFFSFRTKIWNFETKLAVVAMGEEDVIVYVLDPMADRITKITIPGSTRVNVANNLGEWKLSAVWELAKNDGGDELIMHTVTKSFRMPVVAWVRGSENLFIKSPTSLIKSLTATTDTNLSMGDRLRVAALVSRVKNIKRKEINLADTPSMVPKVFIDGEKGYELVRELPNSITSIFSEPAFAGGVERVLISDRTGKVGLADRVGEIVQILGAKVASIERNETKNIDCTVGGENDILVRKVIQVFGCSKEKVIDSNFDLELELGEKFAERF